MKALFYLAFLSISLFSCTQEKSKNEAACNPLPPYDHPSGALPCEGQIKLSMSTSDPGGEGHYVSLGMSVKEGLKMKGLSLGNLKTSRDEFNYFSSSALNWGKIDTIIGKSLPINFESGSDFESTTFTQRILPPVKITDGIGDGKIDKDETVIYSWVPTLVSDSAFVWAELQDMGSKINTAKHPEKKILHATYYLGLDSGRFKIPNESLIEVERNHRIRVVVYRSKSQVFKPKSGLPFSFTQVSSTESYLWKAF
jgi:hypothetical protein